MGGFYLDCCLQISQSRRIWRDEQLLHLLNRPLILAGSQFWF